MKISFKQEIFFYIYFSNFCRQGYQSTGPGTPTKDPTPDYKLIKASEENGYTNIQFERIDTTEGDSKDVQFTVTSVYILLIDRSFSQHSIF